MRLVYIDKNGNEHPVSGRPTSAENLPIAPGSTKSTAEAIEEVKEIIKHEVLTATTNPNGLISYDHSTKRIINAVCTSDNLVLFQIQNYVIVKRYNTLETITNTSVTFDIYYI